MRSLVFIILSINISLAQVSFQESAQQLGVNIICEYTFLGNGITFFDYDNDGWDDITVATAQNNPVYFYKNINGNYVSQTLNISDNNARNKQVNWVDIDNDGDNDLFITSDNSGNRLFENLGNMIMSEITSTSGMLTDNFPYYGASWGDYDNDGFLDVFIAVRDPLIPNILYKNNGDKTFTLANVEAGLETTGYMSFCSAFLDYDNDGDQDIYVSNDKYPNPNLMYKNNGDGTFTEVGAETGTNVSIDAMSVTVEDFNHDGWLDIYITNDPTNNVLYVNNGDGTFTDMAQSYHVTFNSSSWGAVFLDADNDTDLDLYVSGEGNGTESPFMSSGFYENVNPSFFQLNNGAVPNDFAFSYGNAIGDTDNDGLPEIVVNNIDHNNIFLWKNTTNATNNFIRIKLEGTTSNRNGVGSFIEISINGNKQYRYTCLGEGYLSQNSATEHFGLGSNTTIDYVKVKWLSGIEDVLYNVTANQTLNIVEGSTLSVSEFEDNLALSHYPNPVRDQLYLKSLNQIEAIEIYNLLGQKIMVASPKSIECDINFANLDKGTYIVKVSSQDAMRTLRVIKE
ncbi:FG-GAP-like repeat-containing protein [Winogradskyella alexanderae]|uniref:FG-GAP-like repeat-containing protein n=1 Tax=Winogradskyella alexanderae TaxID=2877123 RepID=A0ABS7XTG6_9FLAO|nr:FG-GAP-like repeat-containing protein [Winogradskyella alexanderae]MCA0133080.1 FG-GAP-like repeat-containing protein [Winogradskyella alexanderae]